MKHGFSLQTIKGGMVYYVRFRGNRLAIARSQTEVKTAGVSIIKKDLVGQGE